MNRWVKWIFGIVLLLGGQDLFAATPIQAITFDQNDATGTQSQPSPISLATIPSGDQVSFLQMTSSKLNGPETTGSGAAVAWLENGTEIKAITFAQNGAGALSDSGILNLGSVTPGAHVTDFVLGGNEPQAAGLGAFVAWVENGTNVKAITFDALGMSSFISDIIDLGSVTPGVTMSHFCVTGAFPESAVDQVAVAWVENGVNIKMNIFYQNSMSGSQTGIFDVGTANPGAVITDFSITARSAVSGVASLWVENKIDIYMTNTTPGQCYILLGSASPGATIDHFQVTGDFYVLDQSGAAVAWVENGADFKAITCQCINGGSMLQLKSPILSLGSASAGAVVSGFQLTGVAPESPNSGAAIAWVENGREIKAITFDAYLNMSFTKSTTPLSLASITGGRISNFRLCGSNPESSGLGAAVAWTEKGSDVKAVTFDSYGPTSTQSDVLSLASIDTNGKIFANFSLTGSFPEIADAGAAIAWALLPDTPRSWKRPSNPRVGR